MDIVLFNCTSDKRRVNKNLGEAIATYDCTLDDDTSIMNPTFYLTGMPLTNANKFNYLYCEHLSRFYFVNDVEFCNGMIYKIHCHVDVLMSFQGQLLSHHAFIERNENKSTHEFYDSSYPIQVKNTCYEVPVGVVGNSFGYYLTVNGGVQ
jgi:hypothetical protein